MELEMLRSPMFLGISIDQHTCEIKGSLVFLDEAPSYVQSAILTYILIHDL